MSQIDHDCYPFLWCGAVNIFLHSYLNLITLLPPHLAQSSFPLLEVLLKNRRSSPAVPDSPNADKMDLRTSSQQLGCPPLPEYFHTLQLQRGQQ
jgi:hypothetical protein